jgi:CheY-like chemotaxis protein
MSSSVLIVENEPAVRALLAEILEENGFEVVAVASVAAARGMLAPDTEHFDVVVTDLIMPGESGLELCRTLRSAHFLRPVLAISGDLLQLDDALGAGATACLPKPFSTDDLLNAIQRATCHEIGPSGFYGLEGSPLMPGVYPA